MDNFSYFHLCNHRIKKNQLYGEEATIVVESDGSQINKVINGAILLEVSEVRVLEYNSSDFEIEDFYYDNLEKEQTYEDVDPEDGWYDDASAYTIDYSKFFSEGQTISDPLPKEYYEPILHNRLRWLVKPPRKYSVKGIVRYTHTSYDSFVANDCPICGGKGWFVDIINKDGAFEKTKGIVRIAQRIVKDLLTEKNTHPLDVEYGTKIKYEAVSRSADDQSLFNAIRMVISSVEDTYLSDQQDLILELEDDEILRSLIVEDVFRLPSNKSIVVIQLKIRTLIEEQTFQLGF